MLVVKFLPDYSLRYKLAYTVSLVFTLLSTSASLFYESCYKHLAHSAVLQGTPWATATLDQSIAVSLWSSPSACNASFDTYNPAFVDGNMIAMPASLLLLVSLLSQLFVSRNPNKLPEANIIAILLLLVSLGCLGKSVAINAKLVEFSYPGTTSLLSSVAFGFYFGAFFPTLMMVVLSWPMPSNPLRGRHPPSPEEEGLEANESVPLQLLGGPPGAGVAIGDESRHGVMRPFRTPGQQVVGGPGDSSTSIATGDHSRAVLPAEDDAILTGIF